MSLKGRMELTTEGAALLARLRDRSLSSTPSDYCPTTEAECEQILWEAVVLLKTNNKSGYAHVYPISGRKPWQAKPYIRPKVQRSLCSFHTAEEAAEAVVTHALGILRRMAWLSRDKISSAGLIDWPNIMAYQEVCYG